MLYLNIPYSDKAEVKQLLAQWDPKQKQWYTTNRNDYYKFKKWIPESYVICDYVYIAVAKIKCWKCNKITKVIAFALESDTIIPLYKNYSIKEETGFDLLIYPISIELNPAIKSIMKKNFSCKNKYSKTINATYFANTCEHCDSLQGNFFLYQEVDSPFSPISKEPLVLLKISLSHDIPLKIHTNRVISPPAKILDRCKIIESNYKI